MEGDLEFEAAPAEARGAPPGDIVPLQQEDPCPLPGEGGGSRQASVSRTDHDDIEIKINWEIQQDWDVSKINSKEQKLREIK
jgi:hypothetical protein